MISGLGERDSDQQWNPQVIQTENPPGLLWHLQGRCEFGNNMVRFDELWSSKLEFLKGWIKYCRMGWLINLVLVVYEK